MLPGIEAHCHLKASGILNASNLGDETVLAHVSAGRAFASVVSRLLDLPVRATVIPLVAVRSTLAAAEGTEGPEFRFASIAPESIRRTVAEQSAHVVTEPLTEGAPDLEPLVIAPRFVRTPWED